MVLFHLGGKYLFQDRLVGMRRELFTQITLLSMPVKKPRTTLLLS